MTFEVLYKQNYEPIFKFCFRFLNSREKALDVTQDTFLKLYQQMNRGDCHIENPSAWLYKVAGNKSLNLINTASRQKEIKEQLEFLSTEKSNPESLFIAKENTLRIMMAINGLKQQHQMLVLLYQDGLSYKEMSEATGIPLKSVGKTLWRSIEKISETIKKTDHD
ncbi:MAG: sigma-70 family RNA polymerase sigma factor [Bacteroidales bacterium]|nr:sigma-70 family RNA polymerase sigma factor [Bacteroidales bacterium]